MEQILHMRTMTIPKTESYFEVGSDATLDLNFLANEYILNDTFLPLSSIVSISRNLASYAQTTSGLLVQFAANAFRITDQGLLVEKAATNFLPNSNDFTNITYWNPIQLSMTSGIIAPDNTSTATTFTATVDISTSQLNTQGVNEFNINDSLAYSFSCYVRPRVGSTWTFLTLNSAGGGGATQQVWFNLSGAGAVGTTNSTGGVLVRESIERLANTNWYRISLTVSNILGTVSLILSSPVRGDGFTNCNVNDACDVWGVQVEQSDTPTSYIPTTTAAVARPAEIISGSAASWFAAPGTFYVEWLESIASTVGFPGAFMIGDSTPTANLGIQACTRDFTVSTRDALNTNSANPGTSPTVGNVYKIAFTFTTDYGFRATQNGGAIYSNATNVISPPTTTLWIGQQNLYGSATSTYIGGYIRQLRFFNSAFSDNDLKAED